MPLGYLLPMLFKKMDKASKVILFSVCLSISFECIQYFSYLGSADIDDLILNTLGAISGYYIYCLLKRFAQGGKKLVKISICISLIAFIVAFIIAKEEFGDFLGLTIQNVETIGEENIPQSEADILGTYLNAKNNQVELYNGRVQVNSPEKDMMQAIIMEIDEKTEIYYMSFEKKNKNNSVLTYKEMSKDELKRVEPYSTIKIWKDKINPNLASVIVLSEKFEDKGELVIGNETNNNEVQKSGVIEGIIEDVNEDNMVVNMMMTKEYKTGSSIAINGKGKYADLTRVKFKDITKFKLNLVTSDGKLTESKDCGKEGLEVESTVNIKGKKDGDYFIADSIEIYKTIK